jgi:hypothetical protein
MHQVCERIETQARAPLRKQKITPLMPPRKSGKTRKFENDRMKQVAASLASADAHFSSLSFAQALHCCQG